MKYDSTVMLFLQNSKLKKLKVKVSFKVEKTSMG